MRNSLMNVRGLGWVLAAAVMIVSGVAAAPARAQADDALENINREFGRVPQDKRSDLILLPVLSELQDPPASLGTLIHPWINRPAERAALLGSQGPDWASWKAWAEGAPQKAVLETLPRMTEELDARRAFAFAQPYGIEGVSVELINKGMYTDLGDPPLLARAQHGYMPKMRHMEALAHVEASRLVEAGSVDDALMLMTNWVLFCRQFADRPMLAEKVWGMEGMELGLVRLRDIAYTDFMASPRKATQTKLVEVFKKLIPRGYMDLDRLMLPEGEFAAKLQLINRVMEPGGGVNTGEFATEMARISTVDRPLRRFAAAAYWTEVQGAHAEDLETRQELNRLRNDWTTRWNLSFFDPILQNRTEFQKNVQGRAKFAVVGIGMEQIEELFSIRQRLRVEAAGTRMSLAAYAFVVANNHMPPGLAAVRPAFTDGAPLDKDPYSPPRDRFDIRYFVPGKDTPRGPQGQEVPYVLGMFPPKPEPEFEVPMISNQFVIYSVGPDGLDSMVQNVTQTRAGVRGDYLLWPPLLSLERTYLREKGELR